MFHNAFANEVLLEDSFLDRTGFDAMEDYAQHYTSLNPREILKKMLSGQWQVDALSFESMAGALIQEVQSAIQSGTYRLALPVIVSILSKILIERSSLNGTSLQLFCRIGASTAMMELYVGVQKTAADLIDRVLIFSDAVTPVMIAALNLLGASTTASMLSPVASLGALGISYLMENVALRLIGAGAVIAMVGNLSDNFRLKRLFKLIKSVVIWMSGILMAGFTGLLSIQGLMGSSVDSAAMRGIQFTAESLIPIIGGNVSDSMGSLLKSGVMIKNAIGTTGLVLLISVCLKPMIRLAAFGILMKMCAAITEPAADGCIVDAAAQFGDIAEMLMVICVACVMLVLLLIGACLVGAGNLAR